MFVVEVLAEALEAEPTIDHVLAATRTRSDAFRFHEAFLRAYHNADLEPVPMKDAGEFRPTLPLTLSPLGQDFERYEPEFEFVSRSLLYARSVAVADDLAQYADPFDMRWGKQDCDNGTRLALRTALYGELEKAGLLYYVVPPADYPSPDPVDPDVALRIARATWPRWDVDAARSPTPEYLAASTLAPLLADLRNTLNYATRFSDYLDGQLSWWYPAPSLMRAVMSEGWPAGWPSGSARPDDAYLRSLLSMPTLTAFLFDAQSVRDLLAIRDSPVFARWRNTLQVALRDYERTTTTPLGRDVALSEFTARIRMEAKAATRRIGLYTHFSERMKGTWSLYVGAAASGVATAARFTQHDAAVAVTGGIGAAATASVYATARAIVDWLSVGGATAESEARVLRVLSQ